MNRTVKVLCVSFLFGATLSAQVDPDAITPSMDALAPVMTGFQPASHGFGFSNNGGWPGNILIDVPVIGRVNFGSTKYGLCGGMVFAALDNWIHGGAIPGGTTRPANPSELRSYIYGRQEDSFRLDGALLIRRMISWIPRPMHTNAASTGLHVLSDRQFRRSIRPSIDSGSPVPIALVKADMNDLASGQQNAFIKNHQVLAIGYRLHKEPNIRDHWDIYIYDPNYPRETHILHYSEHFRYQTNPAGAKITPNFRAFFVEPYNSKRPYWVAASPSRRPYRSPVMVDDN